MVKLFKINNFYNEKNEKQVKKTLPLFRTFSDIVFINGHSLKKYDLEKYKIETQQEWQSDEDWYRVNLEMMQMLPGEISIKCHFYSHMTL